ncbi:MAG: gluconeogenesis factor YvcK family protein, partial [Candidatus Bipolaricaulota bacterium]|nr:gluconeogenesis factor YvcK family protein [Candidatus Bipolaricaulota bacterium]
ADLKGHSLGNLLLVGLEQAIGGFDRAIEEMSLILNTRGQVLPATLEKTHLRAQMEDKAWVEGESHITADPRRIVRIILSSENVPPYGRVMGEIERADLILLGPGSLFTSLIPNLLIDGIARAIADARAEKVLVANLMTQPGETDRFTLNDHLQALAEYIDLCSFDSILVNNVSPAEDLLSGYREEASEPIINDLEDENEYALKVVLADLVGTIEMDGKSTVKHDPKKLARAIVRHTRAFSRH